MIDHRIPLEVEEVWGSCRCRYCLCVCLCVFCHRCVLVVCAVGGVLCQTVVVVVVVVVVVLLLFSCFEGVLACVSGLSCVLVFRVGVLVFGGAAAELLEIVVCWKACGRYPDTMLGLLVRIATHVVGPSSCYFRQHGTLPALSYFA